MSTIEDVLDDAGQTKYLEIFNDNEMGLADLNSLSSDDFFPAMKAMGVPIGAAHKIKAGTVYFFFIYLIICLLICFFLIFVFELPQHVTQRCPSQPSSRPRAQASSFLRAQLLPTVSCSPSQVSQHTTAFRLSAALSWEVSPRR
jgi:hypothetical protein